MSMLLLAEKHDELLLKNHGERSTGIFFPYMIMQHTCQRRCPYPKDQREK